MLENSFSFDFFGIHLYKKPLGGDVFPQRGLETSTWICSYLRAILNLGDMMKKVLTGIIVLLLLASLAGCDEENSGIESTIPHFDNHAASGEEQGEVRGARFQITDTATQQGLLTLLVAAEKEPLSSTEAQNILSSPQNVLARIIEFRIEGMWYSLHETGVLTTHSAGQLAEYFQIINDVFIIDVFMEYAK